jgi:quercetin dioxygenase-like cupin family protein
MMDEQPVGRFRWQRPPTPYERFIMEQNIPVHRGIGLSDVRNAARAPWKRTGGLGAFLELQGVGGLSGIYVLEIPAGGVITPEKHVYEEIFLVVEGRGSTEVWRDGSTKKQSFEWQTGSLFSPPLNTWHRLINAAASSPALLLGVTNAPPVFTMYDNEDFIFNTPFHFASRYDERQDYFRPVMELERTETSGRARSVSNLLPDILTCELPLDGQRGPGHRHFTWNLANNHFSGFIAQYPSGRYSKAHAHEGGPVLFCLRGKGYTITWPKSAGLRPWQAENADLVKRIDYGFGGIVSAAPGTADWYHAHFGVSKEPFRVIAFLGGFPRRYYGAPGDEVTWNLDQREGGNTIEYRDEDPQVRKDFMAALTANGAKFEMPESAYR